MLTCTVRGCQLPLRRETRRMVCSNGHSFDIARSGYINLLQPQDRRSRKPGDTAAVVAARRRIHDFGLTAPFLDGIFALTQVQQHDVVLDVGCGEGFYVGSLAKVTRCAAHGVDLAIPAADAAAKRYPQIEWIVANADRHIPYAGQTFSLVLSITGRLNAAEIRRVLKPDGRLLVAVPAPEDLIELRGKGRDRMERTIAEASDFQLQKRERITTFADFSAAGVEDVLQTIYRPLRAEPVSAMRLTLSLDLLLFRA